MSYAESAKQNFLAGYSCSQAVLLAFEPVTGLDAERAARLAAPFGGGVGRMREVCGAVSGALMVLGLTLGYSDPKDADGKSRHYALVREFAARFKSGSVTVKPTAAQEGNIPPAPEGSIICRELLASALVPNAAGGEAEARTAAYYQKRPCPDLCALAAEITAEILRENGLDI